MLALFSMIPFKKEFLAAIILALVVGGFSAYVYNKGYQSAMRSVEVTKKELMIIDLKHELEAAKANTKVVTEYIVKTEYIEKKVPVYVNKVKEIFAYDDSIIIPPALARLHNTVVENGDADTSGNLDDSAQAPITLGTFSEKVIDNYTVCKLNSAQLESLQGWIKLQQSLNTK